ncbi:MAG TPA: hypothetical protein PLX71_02930 [Phycicoccus sp.]|nr:hypothetical protein [Phycicoccus sp.]
MTYTKRNVRLYLANRSFVLLIPVFILALMLLISIAIAAIIGIPQGLPLRPEISDGTRGNMGPIFSVPGFLVSVGAFAMNRNFSMALAFGSTRRHFWAGTSIGFVLTSLVVGLVSLLCLWLELLTNHWFIGAHAFDVYVLGDGNAAQTFATMAVLSLLCLFLGAFFGTVFRAFGGTWTTVAALAFGALILGSVALGVAHGSTVLSWFASMGLWLPILVVTVLAAVAASGSYVVNRFATV